MDDLHIKIAELLSSGKLGLPKYDLDTAIITAAHCLGRLETALSGCEGIRNDIKQIIDYVLKLQAAINSQITE